MHECFILPIKQKIQDKTQTKQLCCLIFFLQLFSATCRCLLCTLWLLPHHFSCLQLSSVLFWGALSSQRVSEGCSVLESVREQNRSTDFFGWSFGGYLQTPLQFYAGWGAPQWGKPQKQATDNSSVITEADAEIVFVVSSLLIPTCQRREHCQHLLAFSPLRRRRG